MWIRVTKEDIRKGHRDDSSACPVALAAKRALKRNVQVDGFSIRSVHGGRLIAPLPFRVIRQAAAFDQGNTVDPFAFQIRKPKEVK